jgi:hypothetical protein
LGQHGFALIAKDSPRIGHFEQRLALFFVRCLAGQVSAFLGVLVILGRFFHTARTSSQPKCSSYYVSFISNCVEIEWNLAFRLVGTFRTGLNFNQQSN